MDNENGFGVENFSAVFRQMARALSVLLTKEDIFENIFSEVSKTADTGEIGVDSTFIKIHQHALSGSSV